MSPAIHSVADARALARKNLPRIVFDYFDGGVGDESLCRENSQALARIRLCPRALVNVEQRDLATRFMDAHWRLPFGIAPIGLAGLTWPGADRMLARAAVQHGIPIALSTMGSCPMERMREWAGDNAWYQLYVAPDPTMTLDLVARVENAGYHVLVLTVDVPEISVRPRDRRNGFTSPFRMGARQFLDFARHPRWSLGMLRHGAPQLENVRGHEAEREFTRADSRAWADWDFLHRLRERWKGRLLVKGILSPADAVLAREAGADGVYVSNHGGRQLNAAPAAVSALPRIREAVGADYPLIFDSGIRDGEDVVRALALGADFVMLGRPCLYGIGADKERGLDRVLDLVAGGVRSTLAQVGRTGVSAIDRSVLWDRPAGAGDAAR